MGMLVGLIKPPFINRAETAVQGSKFVSDYFYPKGNILETFETLINNGGQPLTSEKIPLVYFMDKIFHMPNVAPFKNIDNP